MKRPVLIVLLGILVLIGAGILTFLTFEGEQEPAPPAAQAPAEAPDTSAAQDDATDAAPAEADQPTFDVVRIDPDGNTVMAGRGKPDSDIVIKDGGTLLGTVRTDERGEWVFLPPEPLPPGSRELSLTQIAPDGTETDSEDVVVLVVPEHKDGRTLAVRTGRTGGDSRLLQGAGAPAGGGRLAVDTVDYDENGYLTAGGRAEPGGIVQLYIDNAFVGRTEADDGGQWSLAPEDPVGMGEHMLRADLLDDSGAVKARVEMPFSRVEMAEMPAGLRVVVQPGNSLWLLARQAYGAGTSYTVIYDANKGQIRDPDLIYPGQVFIVPAGSRPDAGG